MGCGFGWGLIGGRKGLRGEAESGGADHRRKGPRLCLPSCFNDTEEKSSMHVVAKFTGNDRKTEQVAGFWAGFAEILAEDSTDTRWEVDNSKADCKEDKGRLMELFVMVVGGNMDVPPTVAETKLNFLKSYKRPIPSIYNNVLQELLVQQQLMRYKRTYQYDAVFALGFVTIYEQLMEGYSSLEDQDAIFRAYIVSLREDPEQYRCGKSALLSKLHSLFIVDTYSVHYRDDAKKLEEWGRSQDTTTLVGFSSRGGDVENILKDIADRVQGMGNFTYSRFFAVGIFRLLELANAAEPSVLEKFCAALKINKRSVDRDLDVYRNLLSKLVQAKELLNEYVNLEKKKREERAESQKANEAITGCVGHYQYVKE
ncbi:hypothetical protein M5K25_014531 [Dendrobium thyrsiflorum]|uniref:Uncharacterized protein n=1 Tax=Dendrobium thyrsiflorum TaxID=117978 RepID=A0ABD0UW10_DENTH